MYDPSIHPSYLPFHTSSLSSMMTAMLELPVDEYEYDELPVEIEFKHGSAVS